MPRPSALNMTLSAFAAGRVPPERLYTASVCRGYRSISPAYRVLSSKPADRRYCCLSMEHSDRWTDTRPLHRPCSAYSAGNVNNIRVSYGWLGSRVVSVLDSGAEGPGFKSQPRRCNSLRQTVHTHRASVHQAAKLVAALLRVAGVTAGLGKSNGSLPSGL